MKKSIPKKYKSITVRLPLLVIVSSVLIMLLIIPTLYYRIKKDMIEDYTDIGRGITNFMAADIDGDKVDEYIEKNFELQEYNDILDHFYILKENYPNVIYMYVYRYTKDGSIVVFDIDSEEGLMDADMPGTLVEIDKPAQPYIDDLCAGKQIPVVVGDTKDGYLLSYVAPVFDSKGNYQCHVGVDFSMEKLRRQSYGLLGSILLVIYLIMLLVLLFDVHLIKQRITDPINNIAKCTHKFSYTTAKERMYNIQLMENLNIKTGDEIEALYQDFLSVLKESAYYITNYGKAKIDIKDKEKIIDEISEVAYKDSLTGAGNKAGFLNDTGHFNDEINEGMAEFAVVMFDINNLKYVNDTYGHDAGDKYIKKCVEMICNEYSGTKIYRLGGDEFVVVLSGKDYEKRDEHYERITKEFIKAYESTDKEPYERYSASVGMAQYEQEDVSFDEVVKRADAAMYDYKIKFKDKYGSYR